MQKGKIAAPTTFPAQQVVITHVVHPQRSQWALRARFARQRAENKCFFAIPPKPIPMLSARRLLLSASQSARQPAAHKLVCPPAAMWRHDRRTAALSPLVALIALATLARCGGAAAAAAATAPVAHGLGPAWAPLRMLSCATLNLEKKHWVDASLRW